MTAAGAVDQTANSPLKNAVATRIATLEREYPPAQGIPHQLLVTNAEIDSFTTPSWKRFDLPATLVATLRTNRAFCQSSVRSVTEPRSAALDLSEVKDTPRAVRR
jgi:hypothetical protein